MHHPSAVPPHPPKVVRLVVDNRVRLDPSSIDAELSDELSALFVHPNPEYAIWERFKKGRRPAPTLATYRRAPAELTFPRGGLERITRKLVDAGYSIAVDDRRSYSRDGWSLLREPLVFERKLWPHQERLIAALEKHEQMTWRSPTASGKTIAVLAAAARLGLRTLVVVPNTAIFDQWIIACRAELGIQPGAIKGEHRTIGAVTIGMQQTLWKCASDYAHLFGFVAFDEVQLAAARTVQETVDLFPARYRLGVSNDERRADEREFLTYDMFGEAQESVDRAELVAAGFVVDVEVRVVPTDFSAPWYSELSTVRSHDRIGRALDPKTRARRLAEQKFEQRPRLLAELGLDDARNEVVVDCVRRCIDEGEQCLVLTERVDHALALESRLNALAPTCRLTGDEDLEEFNANRRGFAECRYRVAVGTFKKVGVGFESHRALARGVIVAPVISREGSEMQFRQYLGRFARAAPGSGKTRGIVYYLHDERVFGTKAIRLLARWIDKVSVLVGDRWVTAKEYLKASKKSDGQKTQRSREPEDTETTDDFVDGWRR